jgi:sulfatase maturation enzyme AslB (radical SAM superfamily)
MRPSLSSPPDIERRSRLDLKAKLRQRSLGPAVERIREGETPSAPVVVELDVTTFCDLACPECISGTLLNKGRFADARLLDLAAELGELGVRAVILIGGGEPLLHPVVAKVIEILGEAGVAVGLTTNGTQINRHLDVIAANVQWTRVSVDAASARTYDIFRPRRGGARNTFSEVIENMGSLARVKAGALGYSYLLMARLEIDGRDIGHHNFGEVAAAAKLARELGCDYVEFKPEYDLAHRLIAKPYVLRALLREELERALSLQSENFEVLAPTHLWKVLSGESLEQPKSYQRCPTLDLRTLITPSGAYACPYHRGNPAASYGDPANFSLRQLWSSEERERMTARIDPSRDCGFNCIRHESNLLLLDEDASPADDIDDYDLFI